MSKSFCNNQKQQKFIFYLENINIDEILKKYNLNCEDENMYPMDTGRKNNDPINDNILRNKSTTQISDLFQQNDKISPYISFIDEFKNIRKMTVILFDYVTKEQLPIQTSIKCYWCRNEFKTIPLGCPIKYITNKKQVKYYSYNIKDNITIKLPQSDNNNNYYYTKGIFCSFNCCKSFIKDNLHNNIYKESLQLLYLLYKDIFNIYPSKIDNAPSWELLIEYGGTLSIEKFRESFNNITYIDVTNFYNKQNLMRPIGTMFEEIVKF